MKDYAGQTKISSPQEDTAPLPAVLVIGELNVDLVLSGLAGPPLLGSEVLAQDLRMVLGSASAIFASGIARLGHPVGFVSKVGDDDFGRFCRQQLEQAAISTKWVRAATLPTGATVVLSTREDRALVTNLGAIADLHYDDIPADILTQHRHLHLTSYFLQSRLRPHFARLVREARAAGLTVSFDPNSDPAQGWDAAIWEVIEAASLLFINEPEALALTVSATLDQAIRQLSQRAACVVIKLGARGAVAIQGDSQVRCDAFPIRVADTTGAGDSFAAGFVHGLLLGRALRECLRIANAAGALSASALGGTAGQPDQAELAAFLKEAHPRQPDIDQAEC